MEKFLICIPVIVNSVVFDECMQQILYKRDVHILIIDNNAEETVKERLKFYKQYPQVTVWHNKINEYVVRPWQTFIDYFLDHDKWDRLIILNSDLTLSVKWWDICQKIWELYPDEILIPNIIDDKTKMYDNFEHQEFNSIIISEGKGIPGVFITLNKKQAELISPLPSELKIWFSDTWVFELLSAAGYKISLETTFLAFHHTSTSIHRVPEALEVIEEDKIAWKNIVEPKMQEKIKQLKNGK